MTITNCRLSAAANQGGAFRLPLATRISLFARRGADWFAAAADYYTAAAVYEQLSRLSDAELHRRGLSRATLGWDICQACDRANI